MKNKEIIPYELALDAKVRGFNEKSHFHYSYRSLTDKELDSGDYIEEALLSVSELLTDNAHWQLQCANGHIKASAPSYQQLIYWIFDKKKKDSVKTQAKWFEFWYNQLRSCSLSGQFVYMLNNWFSSNHLYITFSEQIMYTINVTESKSNKTSFLFDNYRTRELAEYFGILEMFKLIN